MSDDRALSLQLAEQSILACERPDPDWGPPGTKEVTKEVCQEAVRFIRKALDEKPDLPIPMASPSFRGGVSFQWAFDSHTFTVRIFDGFSSYFEIEAPDFRIDYGIDDQHHIIERLIEIANNQ